MEKIYVKRSAISGKTRQFRSIDRNEERGDKITVIADDNGKTVIVSRRRLHSTSRVFVDGLTVAPDDSTLALLERLLASKG